MCRWQNGLFIVAVALCLGNLAEGKEFPSPRTCHQPLVAADMARENQWGFSPMPFPWPFSHDQKANLIQGPRPFNGSGTYLRTWIYNVPPSLALSKMPKPIKMASSSSSSSSCSSYGSDTSEEPPPPPPPRKKAVELFNIAAATPEREAKSGRKFSVRDFIDAEAKEESSKRLPTCSACQLSGHRRGAKACPLYVPPQKERTAAANRPGTSNTRSDSPEEGEITADKAGRDRPSVRAPSKGWRAEPSTSPPRKTGDTNRQRGRSRTLRHFPMDTILKAMGPIAPIKKIPAQENAGTVANTQPPKAATDLVAILGELSALRASVAYLTAEQARLAQFIRHRLGTPPNMSGGNAMPCGPGRRRHHQRQPSSEDDERPTQKRAKHHHHRRSPSPDTQHKAKKERRHHREEFR
ncbi:hypothetical protein niasHT_035714 [Heterodera trifolii]|uniref:Uncharacterized protein n=1 Tax=Heterodera trifolii TaxID=157864 RepID=A0ABD2I2I3_9BILA